MRAAHFQGNTAIALTDAPVPTPGPGQLLLRVGADALCGSERGQFLNGASVTPGHEVAGIVHAAGPGTHTPTGTHGVVFLMCFCEQCRSCRQGFTNLCLDKRGDVGFNRAGGYADYALIEENTFFATPADLPADDATLLLDIMGTGGHAIARATHARADIESLLITGAGPIGLGVLAMATLLLGTTTPVYISDISPYRLALAEKLGGRPLDVSRESLGDALARHGAREIDAAIDTSGKGAARQSALDALSKRGALVCVGHGEGLTISVSRDLIATERSVLGSEYFRYDELPGNLALLRQHSTYLRQIITHRLPLAEIQHAFELFFAGDTGKVVVMP
jgi:threonine 3-dehydrogenase